MKEIPLTQGKVALVDDADYDYLMRWKWLAKRNKRTWYAQRSACAQDGQRTVSMHRVLLEVAPDMVVDHRDGNGLNNQRRNIRVATKAQNCCNIQHRYENTTSRFKGVSWHSRNRAWRACIGVGNERMILGEYRSELEAAWAYDAAAWVYYVDFAAPNFPGQECPDEFIGSGYRSLRDKKTSEFRGVHWKQNISKWAATIRLGGTDPGKTHNKVWLGSFDDQAEAARAYDRAARAAFGEKAVLNFPEEVAA